MLSQEEIDALVGYDDIDKINKHDRIFREQYENVQKLSYIDEDINTCLMTVKKFIEEPLSDPLVKTFRIMDPQPTFLITAFEASKMCIGGALEKCCKRDGVSDQNKIACVALWNKAMTVLEEGKKNAIIYNRALAKKEGRVFST